MAGFDNDVVYASNVDFSGSASVSGRIQTNGQLLIGTTVPNAGGTNINVGNIVAGTGITVGYSSPNITISASGTSGGITIINGNTGLVTGDPVSIVTANSTPVFSASGSTLTLNFGLSNLLLGSLPTSLGTAGNNVGLGILALASLTSGGNGNTCIGGAAGTAITSSVNCVFVGSSAGASVTSTSNGSTGVGAGCLGNWTGAGAGGQPLNTAFGQSSLANLVNGVYNLAIGSGAGTFYNGSESSNILVGNLGILGESNTLRIGVQGSGQAQQNRAFIAGIFGVTVSSPQIVTIDSNGQLGSTASAGSSFTWVEVTGTTQSATISTGYITNNAGLVTVTLPANFAVGDVVRISGSGAGGWRLAANTGDTIQFLSTPTTSGGSLSSTVRYDSVEVIGIVANTTWNVLQVTGNLTTA